MSNLNLRHFIYEVIQIFEYRAHLSSSQRARIIPPSGIIQRGNVRTWLSHNLGNREQLLEKAVLVCELLVFSGLDRDNRQLGCYYVLMALTLCSEDARSAMPWLYEAASYTNFGWEFFWVLGCVNIKEEFICWDQFTSHNIFRCVKGLKK